MKVYVKIKIDYFNDPERPRVERYTLTHKWGDRTCLNGFFRDDFDWLKCKKDNCFFGKCINDSSVTAFVSVYK